MGTPAGFPELGRLPSTSDAIILIIDRKKLHCIIGEGARRQVPHPVAILMPTIVASTPILATIS
jgi:hypothetical protein